MAVAPNFYTDLTFNSFPLTFPVTIQFTDTTTGYPTHWLWSFGDDVYSDSQSPSHTYTIAGSYIVTLLAYKSENTTQINGLRSSTFQKKSNALFSESAAWTAYQADTFSDQGGNMAESWIGLGGTGKFTYLSGKYIITIDLTSLSPLVADTAILYIPFVGNPMGIHGGGVKNLTSIGGQFFTAYDPIGVNGGSIAIPVLEVSQQIGDTIIFQTGDIDNFENRWGVTLGIPSPNRINGWRISTPYVIHSVNSSKNVLFKILNLTSDISGAESLVNFVGDPLIGFTPLDVSFTDTSLINIVSRKWNFGDGNTSTQQNPTNTYTTNS